METDDGKMETEDQTLCCVVLPSKRNEAILTIRPQALIVRKMQLIYEMRLV